MTVKIKRKGENWILLKRFLWLFWLPVRYRDYGSESWRVKVFKTRQKAEWIKKKLEDGLV